MEFRCRGLSLVRTLFEKLAGVGKQSGKEYLCSGTCGKTDW